MAEQGPPITILMPVYRPDTNHFPYAIRSVLEQTFTDFELLLIESASAQPADLLLGQFKDERIRHVVVSPVNRVALINKGLDLAHSPLIARIEQADIMSQTRIQTQIAFLDQDPSISVLGSFIEWIDQQNRPLGYQTFPVKSDAIRRRLRFRNAINDRTAMFWKRAAISEGGFRGHDSVADYNMWARMSRAETTFANVPAPLTQCRMQASTTPNKTLAKTLAEQIALKQEFIHSEMSATQKLWFASERLLLKFPLGPVLRLSQNPRLRRRLPKQS